MTAARLHAWTTAAAAAAALAVPVALNLWPSLLRSSGYLVLALAVGLLLLFALGRGLWGLGIWLRSGRDAGRRARAGHHVAFAGAVGASFALALGVNAWLADPLGLPPGSHAQPFEPNSWFSNPWAEGEDSARQTMLGDLVTRVLPALSREEAGILLGPTPPPEEIPASLDVKPGRTLAYRLGPERSALPLDTEWLLLDYDAEGRYRGFRLRID